MAGSVLYKIIQVARSSGYPISSPVSSFLNFFFGFDVFLAHSLPIPKSQERGTKGKRSWLTLASQSCWLGAESGYPLLRCLDCNLG